MDVEAVLAEVETWSMDDRLRLVHEVWDRLLDQGHEPELTDEMKAELDRRIAEDDAAPEDFVTWDEIMADARERWRS